MVFYVHIMLFFICLNFGLGLAHIPDTPLTISDSGLAVTDDCRRSFEMQGLLMRVPPTGFDSNGEVQWIPVPTNYDGSPITDFNATANNFTPDSSGSPLDNIVDAAASMYQAGETMKDMVLGGYVINVIDSITLSCDTQQYLDSPDNTQTNPNYGKSMDSEVMVYLKAGISIIFGLMLFLFIYYIFTGRSIGF
jgi:hypothetical protein